MVLNVGDMDAVVSRVVAKGGTIEKAAARSAASGNVIAMVRDPSGNRVELLMQP